MILRETLLIETAMRFRLCASAVIIGKDVQAVHEFVQLSLPVIAQ